MFGGSVNRNLDGVDAFQQLLEAARLLLTLSELRKASRYARNLTPAQAEGRLQNLLSRMGIKANYAGYGERRGFGTEPTPWVRGETPVREGEQSTQPQAHEAGHLLMTPPRQTGEEYEKELDRQKFSNIPPPNWAHRQEQGADLIERGLWRRAGVAPTGREVLMVRNKLEGDKTGLDYRRKEYRTKTMPDMVREGRGIQHEWDLGLRRFHDGQVDRANTTDARINSRSIGRQPPNRRPEPLSSPAPLPEPRK